MKQHDVIIVGGSFAGLSAAMTLGRSLRKVLVIDSGKPCNQQSPHAHNFLTRDGDTPADLLATAKAQVLHYPTITFRHDHVDSAEKQDDLFRVSTETGEVFRAKVLLLATGVADQMPDIKGFAECWGISVLHCPYCHGYEVREQKIGLFGNGDAGFELARLIQHWSKNLTLFTHGPSTLSHQQSDVLRQKGIAMIESELMEVEHKGGQLCALRTRDGLRHHLDAMFARVAFKQHSDLAQQIGCVHADMGLTVADEFGRTNIEGVYVVGDSSSFARQISAASASGAKAGIRINMTFMETETSLTWDAATGVA